MTHCTQENFIKVIQEQKKHLIITADNLFEQLPKALSFRSLLKSHVTDRRERLFTSSKTIELFLNQALSAESPEPRAVKRRPKNYPLLMQSRMIAREKLVYAA